MGCAWVRRVAWVSQVAWVDTHLPVALRLEQPQMLPLAERPGAGVQIRARWEAIKGRIFLRAAQRG